MVKTPNLKVGENCKRNVFKTSFFEAKNVKLRLCFASNDHESKSNIYSFFCLARVGKTSLSTKFVKGAFDKGQSSTVDASYLEKTVLVNDQRVKLVIWDTAGQEKYHALAKVYY